MITAKYVYRFIDDAYRSCNDISSVGFATRLLECMKSQLHSDISLRALLVSNYTDLSSWFFDYPLSFWPTFASRLSEDRFNSLMQKNQKTLHDALGTLANMISLGITVNCGSCDYCDDERIYMTDIDRRFIFCVCDFCDFIPNQDNYLVDIHGSITDIGEREPLVPISSSQFGMFS